MRIIINRVTLPAYFAVYMLSQVKQTVQCVHCGEPCNNSSIQLQEKHSVAKGAGWCMKLSMKMGFAGIIILMMLRDNPKSTGKTRKFAFLDDEKIAAKLISFRDETHTYITFYLPQIHCSSCLYLLENLHKLRPGIVSAKVNFSRKEVEIIFENSKVFLREVAEQLTAVGYEPYISLNDLKQTRPPQINRKLSDWG